MRERIQSLIDHYDYKLQMAMQGDNEKEVAAYRLILGDLYDLLIPDDNTATIKLNNVIVEVRMV